MTPAALLEVVAAAAAVLLVWWLWPHCVRPALFFSGASAQAIATVRAIGVVTAGSGVLLAVHRVITGQPLLPLVAVEVLAGALFVAAYAWPTAVARLTGGYDEHEAALRVSAAHDRPRPGARDGVEH